jgi:transposase
MEMNKEKDMAYKRTTFMDIWEIIRRWHNKQSISHIARSLDHDRKIVRTFIQLAQQKGIRLNAPLPPKEQFQQLSLKDKPFTNRAHPAQELLQPFLSEISQLVNNKPHSLKPKMAFEVICQKHDLTAKVSYSSFKRFMRKNSLVISQQKMTCRIEVGPGQEVQVDYAKVGILNDPLAGKNRTVYAFIATLSHSRHKFAQFVFKQDQASFVASHVNMFNNFNGVPCRILIDNLKSGVIKPNLYDPRLNRTYREMAEHYGCFIDPCRVRHPQDKAKVERDVQTVRQQFRKLLALNPAIDIARLNSQIKKWFAEEYGQREHGTTRLKPFCVFVDKEQPALKPLPAEPFEMAQWKEATVHPDHYIQFNKKAYSVPHAYVGKKVWVKATDKILQIFYLDGLIKQHIITGSYRHTDFDDFPENVQAALDDGLPLILQRRAEETGQNFARLIRTVLKPHAFMNMRKAQGLLALAEKYQSRLIEKAACIVLENHLSVTPKLFKHVLEKIQQQNLQNNQPPLSQQSLQFVRQADYFSH